MIFVRFVKIAGAVVLAGVAGTIYYIIKKKSDMSWETVEVLVPVDIVGRFIGRNGCNVKLIEAKTRTAISFQDCEADSSHRVCVICGPEDCLDKAKSLVLKDIQQLCANSVLRVIEVPETVVGGFIGSRGIHIKTLMHSSGTSINVDRKKKRQDTPVRSRRIEIRGSEIAVEKVINIIKERVTELEALDEARKLRRKVSLTPKRRLKSTTFVPAVESIKDHFEKDCEWKCNTNETCYDCDVTVCTVLSSHRIFVQMLSPKLEALADLEDDMTGYYSDPVKQEKLEEVVSRGGVHMDALKTFHCYSGMMVAARHPLTDRWERARVSVVLERSLQENITIVQESLIKHLIGLQKDVCLKYNIDFRGELEALLSQSAVLVVFFVDSGEYAAISPNFIRRLRADYLSLSHQACLVQLANKGDFSEQADNRGVLATYELLTRLHCGEYLPFSLKILEYIQPTSNLDPGSFECSDDVSDPSTIQLSNSGSVVAKDAQELLTDFLQTLDYLLTVVFLNAGTSEHAEAFVNASLDGNSVDSAEYSDKALDTRELLQEFCSRLNGLLKVFIELLRGNDERILKILASLTRNMNLIEQVRVVNHEHCRSAFENVDYNEINCSARIASDVVPDDKSFCETTSVNAKCVNVAFERTKTTVDDSRSTKKISEIQTFPSDHMDVIKVVNILRFCEAVEQLIFSSLDDTYRSIFSESVVPVVELYPSSVPPL